MDSKRSDHLRFLRMLISHERFIQGYDDANDVDGAELLERLSDDEAKTVRAVLSEMDGLVRTRGAKLSEPCRPGTLIGQLISNDDE